MGQNTKLRADRRKLGLSIGDVSLKAGVPVQSIIAAERNEKVDRETFRKIAEALGGHPNDYRQLVNGGTKLNPPRKTSGRSSYGEPF